MCVGTADGGYRDVMAAARKACWWVAMCVALAVATLATVGLAAGFSCALRDARAAASEAVQGKWTVVEGTIEAESLFGIRFRVDRAYAGEIARTITLPGQSNANRVGQPWTFYVQRTPIAYDYTDCGGSHPGLLTPGERSVLGAGSPPRQDEAGLGPAGNIAAVGGGLALIVLVSRRRRLGPPLAPA
jgi:hypothetical protein